MSKKYVGMLICILCSMGGLCILFVTMVDSSKYAYVERLREESIQNADTAQSSTDNIPRVNLTIDEVLRGPEAYQEKLELMLIDTIRAHFLLSPNYRPYNLTNGINPFKHNGQLGQPKIIDKILKGQTNGFFVECGSGNGELLSNSLFFELQRNWTGLLVEPNSKMFAELTVKNRKTYSINACLSIHNYAQEADFFNAAEVGSLQEIPVPKAIKTMRTHNYFRKDSFKSKVQCFPFFSLLLAIGNPIVDIFSLDVEGAEMGVLQTIPWHRVNIRLILLEVVHGDRASLDSFLNSKGYDFHISIGNQDNIYVKRDQRETMDLSPILD